MASVTAHALRLVAAELYKVRRTPHAFAMSKATPQGPQPRTPLKANESAILLASIRSRAIPLDGENARASGYYATDVGSGRAVGFIYEVADDNPNWQTLNFAVAEKILVGRDKEWETDVYSGNRGKVVQKSQMYISKPRGAGDATDYFTVSVYMIVVRK